MSIATPANENGLRHVIAGALVTWTGSPYPDLAVGTVISVIVFNGARRVLALR